MSKPTMPAIPDAAAVRTAPTTPPAGPDRMASRARNRSARTSPPCDCMKCSRTSGSAARRRATWPASTGDR